MSSLLHWRLAELFRILKHLSAKEAKKNRNSGNVFSFEEVSVTPNWHKIFQEKEHQLPPCWADKKKKKLMKFLVPFISVDTFKKLSLFMKLNHTATDKERNELNFT